jgi:shikimate kinase
MAENKSNIVLIGMPGSGKTSIGVILAKMTSRNFVDTDVLLQISHGRSLQDIVDTSGHMVLREVEEKLLLTVNCHNHVIATGGSAIYSHDAMTHLKSIGVIVFLSVDLATLESRVDDLDTRGLAKRPDQSFADLFEERFDLYKKYADVTVECVGLTRDEICEKIISELRQ